MIETPCMSKEVRGRPLDPSMGVVGGAKLAVTSCIGLDATISDSVPREPFERLKYPYLEEVKLEDYLAEENPPSYTSIEILSVEETEKLTQKILAMIRDKPKYFYDIITELKDTEYRHILLAFGILRGKKMLTRDEEGRDLVKGAERVKDQMNQ